MKTVLVDTGPIIALIDNRDSYHTWAASKIDTFENPMITNTAVVVEVLFILKRLNKNANRFFGFVNEGIIKVKNPYPNNAELIHSMYSKYADLPASFADICLLSMIKQSKETKLFTIDSDFLIYHDSKGKPLNLISPYSS